MLGVQQIGALGHCMSLGRHMLGHMMGRTVWQQQVHRMPLGRHMWGQQVVGRQGGALAGGQLNHTPALLDMQVVWQARRTPLGAHKHRQGPRGRIQGEVEGPNEVVLPSWG